MIILSYTISGLEHERSTAIQGTPQNSRDNGSPAVESDGPISGRVVGALHDPCPTDDLMPIVGHEPVPLLSRFESLWVLSSAAHRGSLSMFIPIEVLEPSNSSARLRSVPRSVVLEGTGLVVVRRIRRKIKYMDNMIEIKQAILTNSNAERF